MIFFLGISCFSHLSWSFDSRADRLLLLLLLNSPAVKSNKVLSVTNYFRLNLATAFLSLYKTRYISFILFLLLKYESFISTITIATNEHFNAREIKLDRLD